MTPVHGPNHQRGASTGLLMAAGAMATGAVFGGLPGAAVGVTLVGGVRNAARATRDWQNPDASVQRDAGKSGMLALIEFGIAGWMVWYLTTQHGKKE